MQLDKIGFGASMRHSSFENEVRMNDISMFENQNKIGEQSLQS